MKAAARFVALVLREIVSGMGSTVRDGGSTSLLFSTFSLYIESDFDAVFVSS